MDTYVLRREHVIKEKRSASIPAEAHPSLRNFVGRERAWLDHWMHMDELFYKTPPGLDSKRLWCQDEAPHPKRVLYIFHRLRDTWEKLNPRPFFVLFALLYDKMHFFSGRARWRDRLFAEQRTLKRKQYRILQCWNRNEFSPPRYHCAPCCTRMLWTAGIKTAKILAEYASQLRLFSFTSPIISFVASLQLRAFIKFCRPFQLRRS